MQLVGKRAKSANQVNTQNLQHTAVMKLGTKQYLVTVGYIAWLMHLSNSSIQICTPHLQLGGLKRPLADSWAVPCWPSCNPLLTLWRSLQAPGLTFLLQLLLLLLQLNKAGSMEGLSLVSRVHYVILSQLCSKANATSV